MLRIIVSHDLFTRHIIPMVLKITDFKHISLAIALNDHLSIFDPEMMAAKAAHEKSLSMVVLLSLRSVPCYSSGQMVTTDND